MARLFTVNKIPVSLENVTHESELRRGENRVKVAVLHCKVALTRKHAAAMPDGVLRRLYAGTNEDVDPLTLRHDFPSLCDRQILTVAATPDSDPTEALDQVRIYGVHARRTTTENAFTLRFKCSFGPLSSKEWAFIDLWRTTQRIVNFSAAQKSLEFELAEPSTTDDDETTDESQPGLLDKGTCAHGCRVGEACEDCPEKVAATAPPEPQDEREHAARILPHRNPGGKRKNTPRRPTTH